MSIKESISAMLDQLAAGNNQEAENVFRSIVADKVGASLENMKVDVANQMFNGAVVEEGVISNEND